MIYGATRSTAQIEEGGGRPGYSLVTVHDRVPSWRFKEIGTPWPFVQIVAPADVRMVTRPADPQQVPRPGEVAIVAKLYGRTEGPVLLTTDDGTATAMTAIPGTALWQGIVRLDAGIHDVVVTAGGDRDAIKLLVRDRDDIPRRGMPVAPGSDIHAIGAWPEKGIEGTRLGPNKNGMRW